MKTLVIYNTFDELAKFRIVVGDFRHLDKLVINAGDITDDQQDQLDRLFFTERYKIHPDFSEDFPIGQHFDYAINVGFAP